MISVEKNLKEIFFLLGCTLYNVHSYICLFPLFGNTRLHHEGVCVLCKIKKPKLNFCSFFWLFLIKLQKENSNLIEFSSLILCFPPRYRIFSLSFHSLFQVYSSIYNWFLFPVRSNFNFWPPTEGGEGGSKIMHPYFSGRGLIDFCLEKYVYLAGFQ